MHPCSFCAGMRRPMRAGRFLDMPEVLPQRGAASGGQRPSRWHRRRRLRAPRSGTTVRPLARAFFWTPGFAACWSAVVRAAMRVHMCGRCGGAAGLAGFVVGSAFVCVRSGAAPVWSAQCEVWSRDVFVSSSELVIEYYNMSIRSIKIFTHSYHLADALAPLWHKSRQPMGSQASTRPRTSRCATRWRR